MTPADIETQAERYADFMTRNAPARSRLPRDVLLASGRRAARAKEESDRFFGEAAARRAELSEREMAEEALMFAEHSDAPNSHVGITAARAHLAAVLAHSSAAPMDSATEAATWDAHYDYERHAIGCCGLAVERSNRLKVLFALFLAAPLRTEHSADAILSGSKEVVWC